MQVRPLVLPIAAMLCTSAPMAHASVSATDVGFSCSQTLSIDDSDGFVLGCTGDLRVFGGGTDSVLSHPGALTLRATSSLRLDDVRLVSPRIVLDAPQVFVSEDTRLDASRTASWPSTGSTGGQLVLSAGGDVRLGEGLDPNRVRLVDTGRGGQAGSVVLAANFSGVVFGSQFNSDAHLSARTPSIEGKVAGAFFGPGGASSSIVDVTRSGLSGGSRYITPFMPPRVDAGTLSPVPEPSGWVLAGAAGLALIAFGRRRGA